MYCASDSDGFDFDHDAESGDESAAERSFSGADASASDYNEDDDEDDDEDEEEDENHHPNNATTKAKHKATTKKKSAAASATQAKTIEETYQKKTQLEHILLRPDTYIGSVEPLAQPMFVWDADIGRLRQRDIVFTPGFYKIFDEILVNAADNKQRDSGMNRLEVEVDAARGVISVLNNGKGIPIVKHKEHGCYVATLIFGQLLTGSNFDDKEEKTTGGRNGYGAKLANIFSRKFTVECVDAAQGLKFSQVWRNNMHKVEEPVVAPCSSAEKKSGDYVRITFRPDLEKFNMAALDEDAVGLISKRTYDIAGSMANKEGKRLHVYLNGVKLKVKDFKSYLELFDGIAMPEVYEKVGDEWEVGVGSVLDGGGFQQISFVNAIATTKGGGHVDYITNLLTKHLQGAVKKKNKGGKDVKPAQVRNHLSVFINCLVPNPTFDSQAKENLTTKPATFKKSVPLSPEFLKKIEKCGVVESIMQFAKFQEGRALQRKGGTKKNKLKGISKLDDANFAGTTKSQKCTLILTEGDSAKSLAVSGLSVIGRDYYGVFPLKGKPLNVRDATHRMIMKNEEIMNLVEIMGLKFKTEYTKDNMKLLRYGHLMIMADQDHDGSHIKGLIINMIHHFWPSLLDVPHFLQQFITPIVKCTKGKKSSTFYTLPQFSEWKESTGNEAKGWKIKYYKGLGTSTSSEAKEYFSNLDIHEIHFNKLSSDIIERPDSGDETMDIEDEDDVFISSGAGLIDMAFNKTKADERKKWLSNIEKNTFLNYQEAQQNGVKYSDFVNKELALFSQYDVHRSLPHLLDGLKVSQRKVLYACFKKKLKNEIKVAQLAGYIGEHSAYHHGEMSLHGTIVGMAQSYCGSNNVNLLYPSGQFGTRRLGGKDHASARYIFTRLEKVTRSIFHPDDDDLLTYLNDDGLSIEPEYYIPVIPVVLVNGSDGIGTGWSSNIKSHNPREIISNIRRMISKEEPREMQPYFYGWTGEMIAETGKREGCYITKGKIKRTNNTTLLIEELPVGRWTQDYKEKVLEKMIVGSDKTDDKKKKGGETENGEKIEHEIMDFKENHTDTTVSFTVIATKESIDAFEQEKNGLHGTFKLTATISTKNMTVFDKDGKIRQFKTSLDILRYFFRQRMIFYIARKDMLLYKMRRDLKQLENKARFVEEVCRGDLVVSSRKRSELLGELKERGYELFPKDAEEADADEDNDNDDEGAMEETTSDAELAKGYEYLLGMKIWSLTFERAEELRRQKAEKAEEVERLVATSPETIWLADLDAIEELLDERDKSMGVETKKQKRKSKSKALGSKKSSQHIGGGDWDSELEESEPEESDIDSDSSEDDFFDDYVAESVPKVRAVPKKRTAKTDVPVPKLKNDLRSILSDNEMDCSVSSKEQSKTKPKSKSKNKALEAKMLEGRDSRKHMEKDSEPEVFNVDSDLSDDDFAAEMPTQKARTAAKKVSTKADKRNNVLCDIGSGNDSDRSVPSKKQKQSKSKGKVFVAKKATNKTKKQEEEWDSNFEESKPEESDEYSDSSDDDFVAAKPASRVRNAPNKTSTKADKPVFKQDIMSDSESDRSVPSKKQKQSKSKNKSLGAKKTTNKSKKQEDDWDSEIEESEPEESDMDSDSSDDDFVVAMPAQKSRTTAKKAPAKVDKLVSKRKNVHQDTMSEDESDCSISSKKQKQSNSKIKALSAKTSVDMSKHREEGRDIHSDSAEDDLVATKPTRKVQPAPSKVAKNADQSLQKYSMSDDDSDFRASVKNQKQTRFESKALDTTKSATTSKTKEEDWDSDVKESEHEESDLETISSDDDFVISKPAQRFKTKAKKVPTEIDTSVSKSKSADESVPVKKCAVKGKPASKFKAAFKRAPTKAKKVAKYKSALGDISRQGRRTKIAKKKAKSKGKTIVSLGISPTWRLNLKG